MYFNLQQFTLPDFGLMTAADKLKLDGIDTSTLLTKTEASETYATKAEMREYIRQVLESDTGFVFIDGTGSEVAIISALGKQAQSITLDPTSVSFGYNASDQNVTVTRLGEGAITASLPAEADGNCSVSVSGNVLTFVRSSTSSFNYTATVNVAETDAYESGTATITVTAADGNRPEPV